jgi:RNA polymerase sigma-70 factor (ECF subfamily)
LDSQAEEQLVASCRDGDRNAYAQLVRRHAGQVFAVCLGMVGDAHDAEDLAQDALVRGFAKISRLRKGRYFRAWITGIARNLCVDHLRRRKTERAALASCSTTKHTARTDFRALQGAVLELPEQYRLPLLLYYFDGHSIENIGIALGLSPAAVSTRLSRARRQLRERIDHQRGA